MSAEYRIEVKVKNNNILKLIEKRGYSTVGEFCRLNPTLSKDVSTIGELVNLKLSPLSSNSEYRPVVYRLCDALECMPEDLFTETQMTTALETNKRILQVNEAEMKFTLENMNNQKSLEQILDEGDLGKKVVEVLETLTPREEKIIGMRFGINGYSETPMDEIAKYFDVSRNRIKQIQQTALRKLRHLSRADGLKEYIT